MSFDVVGQTESIFDFSFSFALLFILNNDTKFFSMIELSYFSNSLDMLLKVLFETRNLVHSHY